MIELLCQLIVGSIKSSPPTVDIADIIEPPIGVEIPEPVGQALAPGGREDAL